MDTLHPGARRIVERVEEDLGQACSGNLRGRSSCLPEVHGADADAVLLSSIRDSGLNFTYHTLIHTFAF
jgi:hypothetical protein